MSTLRVNTIQNAAGSGDPTLNGTAKAWVNFNGTGTVAIRAAFNVTSITDNGTGDYTLNFTNAMADANYSVVGSCNGTSGAGFGTFSIFDAGTAGTGTNQTSSLVRVRTIASSATADVSYVNVSIFR